MAKKNKLFCVSPGGISLMSSYPCWSALSTKTSPLTEVVVNGSLTDKIFHFFLQIPFHFYHCILICLILNNTIFVSCGGRKRSNGEWGLHAHSKRNKKEMLVMLEQQHLKGHVKVICSVNCVFDPVETHRRDSEVKPNGLYSNFRKKLSVSHFPISDHCLSRVLVLFYSLINSCIERDYSEHRILKREVEEGGCRETAGKWMLKWILPILRYSSNVTMKNLSLYVIWECWCTEVLRIIEVEITNLNNFLFKYFIIIKGLMLFITKILREENVHLQFFFLFVLPAKFYNWGSAHRAAILYVYMQLAETWNLYSSLIFNCNHNCLRSKNSCQPLPSFS